MSSNTVNEYEYETMKCVFILLTNQFDFTVHELALYS